MGVLSEKVVFCCCRKLSTQTCTCTDCKLQTTRTCFRKHRKAWTCCCFAENGSALICQLRGLAFLIWSAQGPDLFRRYVWKASFPDILTNVCQLRWHSSKTWWLRPLHEIMDRKFHVNAAAHGGSDPLRS